MTKTVLILGASGRFGRNSATAFSWANWNVRRFDRNTDSLPDAAWGADVIVNAWNPAYPDWERLVPAMTEQVINTAKDTGATILIPGNVYNYGANMPAQLRQDTPQRPTGTLGAVRQTMELAYRDAGVKTIVLRAGDFIDTTASGNWYDKIVTAKLSKGTFTYPGDMDTPHAWAFLHDLADAAVMLCDRSEDLPQFFEVNFPGYTLTGHQLHQALQDVIGRSLTARKMPWWPLKIAQPFWPMAASLLETRYLWQTPHHMMPDHFEAVLPEFTPTPLLDAIAASLPDDVHDNGVMPRPAASLRRPFNFCCPNAKAT